MLKKGVDLFRFWRTWILSISLIHIQKKKIFFFKPHFYDYLSRE